MSTEMNKAAHAGAYIGYPSATVGGQGQPQAQTLNIQIPQHSSLRHSQSNTAISSKRLIPQVLKSLTGHSLTFIFCLIHLILIVPTFQVLELVLVASLNISAQIN